MVVAEVVLDIATQALDKPYSYAVPEDMEDASVGCAVLVPFGRQKAIGFIMSVLDADFSSADFAGDHSADSGEGDLPEGHFGFGAQYEETSARTGFKRDSASARELKPIEQVLSKPFFDEAGAECAQYLAKRYVAPLSACVRLFTPPGGVPRIVRNSYGHWELRQPDVGEVDDRWVLLGSEAEAFTPRKNAVKQKAILDALKQGDLRVTELATEFGDVSAAINSLAAKGVVKVESRRRMRGAASKESGSSSAHFGYEEPKELTPGQRRALEAIEAASLKAAGEVVLVDGVTGSGKTEVYLKAIERTLQRGQNAIVLVPEISLTPQTVARFRGRFGNMVAVMHSRMSQGERYDQWDFIQSGDAHVVVGARSALFTPLKNVGLVIIDEEHETTYKQESAPRYVSRDVASWMMKRSGGTLVLGSATPSIDALYKAHTLPGWTKVSLPERANGNPLPQIEVIDMASEFSSGARSMFSRRLVSALKEELAQNRKAVLLLNQRGFAKFLLCRDCGFVPECVSCSTSLTYHESGNKLVCHHCGYTVAVPAVCPSCGSPYLKKFGAGTQRVEAELRNVLDAELGVEPAIPIIRMDADTTSAKGAHQRLLEEFAAAPQAVLLGTQMIAKGLDFDDVTLVGVINADTQLHLPDFRAAERTFDLIEQVAGRAGRAELPGRVLVQTYEAESVAIRAAAVYDREMFLRTELPKREVLKYPPFVRMANVLVWGKNEEEVKLAAVELRDKIANRVADFAVTKWDVLAANPCVLSKVRNNYRWHIVVKCPPDDDLSGMLEPIFRSRKTSKTVNVALDIDPIDLL